MSSVIIDAVCNCNNVCMCYSALDKVVQQEMEYPADAPVDEDGLLMNGICIVTYESGAVQRLKRD